jgi:hypothetical protein
VRANPRALWAVVCGVLSVLAVPAGVFLSRESKTVTLINSSPSILFGAALGFSAVLLARRARERVQITLGRAGGETMALAGRLLGIFGVLLAITAGLALAFYGLLSLFAA